MTWVLDSSRLTVACVPLLPVCKYYVVT